MELLETDELGALGVGVGAFLLLAGLATAVGTLGQVSGVTGVVRILAALGTAGVGGALAWLVTR